MLPSTAGAVWPKIITELSTTSSGFPHFWTAKINKKNFDKLIIRGYICSDYIHEHLYMDSSIALYTIVGNFQGRNLQ